MRLMLTIFILFNTGCMPLMLWKISNSRTVSVDAYTLDPDTKYSSYLLIPPVAPDEQTLQEREFDELISKALQQAGMKNDPEAAEIILLYDTKISRHNTYSRQRHESEGGSYVGFDPVTIFYKELVLTGYLPGQTDREVVNIIMQISNSSADLRGDLPFMLTAGMSYFNKNTGSMVNETIYTTNKFYKDLTQP